MNTVGANESGEMSCIMTKAICPKHSDTASEYWDMNEGGARGDIKSRPPDDVNENSLEP